MMIKDREIRFYKEEYHPVIDYIKKYHFQGYDEKVNNYINFFTNDKKRIRNINSVQQSFTLNLLNENLILSVKLITKFDKKVEDEYIVIVERTSLIVSEIIENSTGVNLILSDTGKLIINGSNSSPKSTKYKELISNELFGKYFLNKKLNENLPEKTKEKRIKI